MLMPRVDTDLQDTEAHTELRGLIQPNVRAREINDEMKIAAAHAIAALIPEQELSPDSIIPKALDRSVSKAVAEAVKEAARRTGVARI